MDKDLINDYRAIVLPVLQNVLIKTNYEGKGYSDAIEFEKDFNEILRLAEKALDSEWIPIKQRPGTDEEYEEFCKYGDCPREYFRVFECPLPDDDQEVLVTTRWGHVCIDIWHRDVDCCYFETYCDDDDVIAWMPLPESYKKEGDENERSTKEA